MLAGQGIGARPRFVSDAMRCDARVRVGAFALERCLG